MIQEPVAPQRILDLVEQKAEEALDSAAMLGVGRPALSYRALRDQIRSTAQSLNDFGIGRNDRVALVLPNGPDLAVAFLAVAAAATCAPLNPAYRAEEFDFYLTDLKTKALILFEGSDSEALAVAEKRRIPVFRLVPGEEAPAGVFSLRSSESSPRREPESKGLAEAGDIALVLHTSGTTSRPKIVPLTQQNLCASARHISQTLELTPDDRCLNVMPLFHIHGLVGAVLSTLAAGGSLVATPGFDAIQFFAWLDEFQPTWYTAVPTMHQLVLARASRNHETVARSRLRFIRSSSASLPPQVMGELERVFGAPVIESYGMTEAAHQMASNPLPPAVRKPGSVGLPAGPEIAILDSEGRPLDSGEKGEIAIRGPNVTPGYENPEANAKAFANGWLRTGDEGYLDADGYLSITGRLKEIINRGGEKISPREVDEVLLGHPAVAQVVTFALPHPRLGEEVAAAIVLRDGHSVSEKDIRKFAAQRLSSFKVPSRVVVVEEIPKGPTGKLQRIGLAEKLGLA